MSERWRDWRVVWESCDRDWQCVETTSRERAERLLRRRPGGVLQRYVPGVGWVPATKVA